MRMEHPRWLPGITGFIGWLLLTACMNASPKPTHRPSAAATSPESHVAPQPAVQPPTDSLRLTGTVRDDAGEPIAGACVTARFAPQGLPASGETSTVTAADGGYQLGPLVTGPHLIRIESENHLGMQPTEHRIDASTEPLDFTLTRPTRVQGILVDTGGHPLSRRMVSLRRITRATGLQGRLEASSYTDLDGGFVLLSRSRGEGCSSSTRMDWPPNDSRCGSRPGTSGSSSVRGPRCPARSWT